MICGKNGRNYHRSLDSANDCDKDTSLESNFLREKLNLREICNYNSR